MADDTDITPDGGVGGSGAEEEWVPLSPAAAGAVRSVALQRELDSLRDALEEKDLQLLEAQSEHVKVLAKLRGQLEARDRAARDGAQELAKAKQALLDARNKAMAERLDAEEACNRLREELERARLRLELSEDRNRELAAAGSTAHEAESKAAAEARAHVRSLQSELGALRAELDARCSELASRDSELAATKAHVSEQASKVKALQQQLGTFISRDAKDAAHTEMLERDLAETRAQLEKRVSQLQTVLKTLAALRTREADVSAQLEAQSGALAQLQRQYSVAAADAARWKTGVDVLQARCDSLTSEVESLRERVEELEGEAAANDGVVAAAMRSAEHIKALTHALQVAKEDNDALSSQLEHARVDARREMLALQRVADERQQVIAGLQADLSAATAAITAAAAGAAGGGGAAGSGGKGRPSMGGGAIVGGLVSGAAGAPSAPHAAAGDAGGGRRRMPLGVGSTGGKAIVAHAPDSRTGGHDGTGGGSGGGPTLDVLRLQLESLHRTLAQRDARIHTLESEQEELLVMNEKLRHALERGMAVSGTGTSSATSSRGAASPGSAAATAMDAGKGGDKDASPEVAAVALVGDALAAERLLSVVAVLLRRVRYLADFARAVLDGGVPPEDPEADEHASSGSQWLAGGASSWLTAGGDGSSTTSAAKASPLPMCSVSARFPRATAAVIAALERHSRASDDPAAGGAPRQWHDIAAAQEVVSAELRLLADLKAHLAESTASKMESACATQ